MRKETKEIRKWFRIMALQIRLRNANNKTKHFNQDLINRLNKKIEDLGGPVEYKYGLSYDFRHRHIAWCLFRGKTIDQIEKPSEDNNPNAKLIQKYMEEFNEKFEALCVN